MKILDAIPPAALPKVHLRSFFQKLQQGRAIIVHKRRVHIPRSTHPTRNQVMLTTDPWGRWRRMWLAFMGYTWTHTLTADDRLWWDTEASANAFQSHRGVTAIRGGYAWYLNYQFKSFDTHPDRYIPYPANAADFPRQYIAPWNPPTLEAPTIVSATQPPLVVVRCLNVSPAGLPLDPVCQWLIHPPIAGTWPISTHPWYYTSSAQTGDHTDYTYDLSVPFPWLKSSATAVLVHCYGVNPTKTTAKQATTAASVGTPPAIEWFNLAWATNCDNLGASVAWLGGNPTQQLQCTNYPFPLLDAPILGIQLTIRRWAWVSHVTDSNVQLMKAGSPVGTNKAAAGEWSQAGYVNKTYGGPTDLWGTYWTPNDLLDAGFGATLTATCPGNAGAAYVDCMTITVWTPSGKYQFTNPTQHAFAFPN